jgi:hypothetical protein
MVKDELNIAVKEQNMEPLIRYSERVKVSGKSIMARHLEQRYYHYIQNQEYI